MIFQEIYIAVKTTKFLCFLCVLKFFSHLEHEKLAIFDIYIEVLNIQIQHLLIVIFIIEWYIH